MCLRGGEEHRNLKLSQFKKNDIGYIYTENCSKNRPGGYKQLNTANKIVTIVRSTTSVACHCFYMDEYLKRLPQKAIENDNFYVRPLPKFDTSEGSIWFTSVPIGRNKLAKMTSDMCKNAGIGGHKTNHSLNYI